MKTRNRMLVAMMIAFMTVHLGFAQDTPKEVAKDTSADLNAQIGVTHDEVQQMISKLENHSSGVVDPAANADYIAKAKTFDAKVEKAMIQFEATMKDDVLQRANLWLNRINGIQNSQDFDDLQKSQQKSKLINQQVNLAQKDFQEISVDYARAIQNVYEALLPKVVLTRSSGSTGEYHYYQYRLDSPEFGSSLIDVEASNVQWDEKHEYKDNFNTGQNIVHWNATGYFRNNRVYDKKVFDYQNYWAPPQFPDLSQPPYFWNYGSDLLPEVQKELFSKIIVKGCFSNSCLTLFSDHIQSFLDLVKGTIDKVLPLTAAGNSFTLTPFNLTEDRTRKYFDVSDDNAAQLPYEISAQDYRQKVIKELSAVLTDSKLNFKNGCPTDVVFWKDVLCHSDSGCINASETATFSVEIENSAVKKSSKPARVSCLSEN